MKRRVSGHDVVGLSVDAETRCAHWHGPKDIIAIKFFCCGQWYPCFECHQGLANHKPQVWPLKEHDSRAVLCGACGFELSVAEYLSGQSRCPACSADFNPGCAHHYHLYFAVDAAHGVETTAQRSQ
jgi:uncharacterized CHY-type Zn-finger protein